MECYNGVLKDQWAQFPNTSPNAQSVNDFFDKGGEKFISALESEFECGSLCKTPLFYLTKNADQGAVTQDCVTATVNKLTDNKGAAAVAGLTGVLLWISAIGAFPLMTGLSQKPEEEK